MILFASFLRAFAKVFKYFLSEIPLAAGGAQLGDEVVLTLVDGSQRRYVVSEIRPKVVWNDMSVLAPTPTEQLTLQTCTSYQQTAPRFLVIAIPEQ